MKFTAYGFVEGKKMLIVSFLISVGKLYILDGSGDISNYHYFI